MPFKLSQSQLGRTKRHEFQPAVLSGGDAVITIKIKIRIKSRIKMWTDFVDTRANGL